MPVFECSRCNHLTYSATRRLELRCDRCGGDRLRVLDAPVTFEEARDSPRLVGHGDHACVAFDDPEEAAPVATAVLRAGVSEGAVVHACVADAVEQAIRPLLGDDAEYVEWLDPAGLYGAFDADGIIARYRALVAEREVFVVAGSDRPMEQVASLEHWQRYERMVHELATETGLVVLCLFDRAFFPEPYSSVGAVTHPLEAAGPALRRNERFRYEAA